MTQGTLLDKIHEEGKLGIILYIMMNIAALGQKLENLKKIIEQESPIMTDYYQQNRQNNYQQRRQDKYK